ncbi:MAG TPA: CBS domain-containing protein, partial [Candidatus Binatia bacterium]|nr:CBS domain-containing protein [Candidatus Binatia bacterium]
VVRDDCPLPEVLRVVGQSRGSTFPVVDAAGALVGVLPFAELRALLVEQKADPVLRARDLADPPPPALTPETSLGEAFRRMESEGTDDLPVVDPAEPRRLLGMLSRADLIAAFNRTVAALGAASMPAWLEQAEPRWDDQYRVVPVDVPPPWVGRSLRDLDCRARFGVAVLAVRHRGARDWELPDPARPLEAGDVLVMAGTSDALRLARAA